MTQTFSVKTCCFKCQCPMKEMWIAGFKIPYCPKCTSPNKKKNKFRPLPDDISKILCNKAKDKKYIHDYYWKKGTVKISVRKSKAMKEKERIHKMNLKIEDPCHKLLTQIIPSKLE